MKRYPVFSHDELVCKIASNEDIVENTAQMVHEELLSLIDCERKNRKILQGMVNFICWIFRDLKIYFKKRDWMKRKMSILNFYQTMNDNASIVKLHVLHRQSVVLVNQVSSFVYTLSCVNDEIN